MQYVDFHCNYKRSFKEHHSSSYLYEVNDIILSYLSLNEDELQYLSLVAYLIRYGENRDDRTGVGTRGVFGITQRYSLSDMVIPLLTTKSVHFPSVCKELLWMISGCTDERVLRNQKVKIWSKNSDDFHKRQLALGNINHIDGDCGKIYGSLWRAYGKRYINCETQEIDDVGIDQLANVIDQIKNNPISRRIILNAWDPRYVDPDVVALPPCHVMYQFYVSHPTGPISERELSCECHMRSSDTALGLPFNIASAALFTHMIAHVCGIKAKELIMTLGDSHLYSNHLIPIAEQLDRIPSQFPTLKITNVVSNINDFKFEDFQVLNYSPQAAIKMDMAV